MKLHGMRTIHRHAYCLGDCLKKATSKAPFVAFGKGKVNGARHIIPFSSDVLSHSYSTSSSPLASHPSGIRTNQSPMQIYTSLVGRGLLRHDTHQLQTIHVLEALYTEILTYKPLDESPSGTGSAAKRSLNDPRSHIASPDFKWIEENEQSIFSKLLSSLSSLTSKKQVQQKHYGPKGLYMYGDVGTGKSMLMDLLFNSIPSPSSSTSLTGVHKKKRTHFHTFMRDVHQRIHRLRSGGSVDRMFTDDPIPIIARDIAAEATILCFDELQVTDITDAMILRRLFEELFGRGVVLVVTSNRHPDDLYQNGIQRQHFLPAIALLKDRCLVHSLNSGVDYRRIHKKEYQVFFRPLNEHSRKSMNDVWEKMVSANGKKVEQKVVSSWGRNIVLNETCGPIVKISFQDLCGSPLSASDYLSLCQTFHTFIVTDIPRMTIAQRNEARRFITFIDTVYDNRLKLVASMDAPVQDLLAGDEHNSAEEAGDIKKGEVDRMLMDDLKLSHEHLKSSLFTGDEELFAFERAVSRLVEMQSVQWLGEDLARFLPIKDSSP